MTKIKLDKETLEKLRKIVALRQAQSSITPKEQMKYYLTETEEKFTIRGRASHIILWLVIIFILAMLIWAYFAILDEVTVVTGQVIPSQKTQVISNLEGGIVKEILVTEGQEVEKGQLLMRLDEVKYASSYQEGRAKQLALELRVGRLEAEVNGKNFVIAPEFKQQFPELVDSELALYNSKKHELKYLENRSALLEKELRMTQPLLKEGAVSEVELLRLQQQLDDIKGAKARFLSLSLQELNATKAEVSRLKEANLALKDQLVRTEIRSPVKGIVKQIYISTIGGIVKPGMPLVEVVPLDDTLLIEGRVNPKDIGFLHVGQDALIKVSAYDFSIYGGLDGDVEHIGADTTLDQKGNSYYEIWVRTDRNYLEKNNKKLRIIPGMQVSVDILTGEKSVLDYLLKPILKTKAEALRER